MSVKVKPIQPTPELTGLDAIKIIQQVRSMPSKASLEKNKRMLEMRKKVANK